MQKAIHFPFFTINRNVWSYYQFVELIICVGKFKPVCLSVRMTCIFEHFPMVDI